ncbi:cobalamin biosynthesis protein CobD [Malaciobacter molluscorum LMG 25693]|uniref:Cobalamin biosynthesis protein CobD n=1 Tax=Malaciobacter molluscorum LMG 25693 TaxID=870501 RepID=A0A2G1DG60_9BACT|nr:adenosylcobinamide-phosphate synthase CbiB [Malaciobacter molluscorum]AXX93498.1 adenosylcobinamide-phosphate synthase [Malaciobacter molluscorum LMG 25693]PHO17488.1 cobalamin biosynthesis protein CobD [Malaciobacter molluscorum LMG 25693]
MFYSVALIAFLLDKFFGEFEKLNINHPIIYIGNLIKFFENRFYKDSIFQGLLLTLFTLSIVFIVVYSISFIESIIIQGFLASFTLSSKMLYDCVLDVLKSKDIEEKKEKLSMLVSRDTKDMTNSDINKASIETYAENLSDGVIAPLFYLICFGLIGAYLYKAINTLDSMVGYRNKRYERFGKVSARLDDIANYIPSRITAILIAILFKSKKALKEFYQCGKKHESLNAGLPIASMAFAIKVKLGGPTSYFGKIKQKPYFGIGNEKIEDSDVYRALSFKSSLDIFIIIGLGVLYALY